MEKKERGQFFTADAYPFTLPSFNTGPAQADIASNCVLEPFAGSNNIIKFLREQGYIKATGGSWSFDINPQDSEVEQRDTMADFPTGYDVCVTNPPWISKTSATIGGLDYGEKNDGLFGEATPMVIYNNLYKEGLDRCLKNCGWVAHCSQRHTFNLACFAAGCSPIR